MATTGTGAGLGTSSPATGTIGGAGTYGKVILTIKSAHNMSDKAWIGKSDPYAVVKLADAEIRTNHVKNAGEHCVWDESFAFSNVAPDDVIEFNVYDHNRLIKDAHMGEGRLTLRQVFEEGRLETRIPLSSRTGMKDAGELWVSLRREDAGTGAGMGAGTETLGTGAGLGSGASAHREHHHERRDVREEERATSGYGQERYSEREGVAGLTGAGMTTGTTDTSRVAEAGVARQGQQAVCSQEFFTKTEDRPIIKERVTYIKEHRPVEKEFVVETRATGQERETMEGRDIEHMGAQERIVSVAEPKAPCE